MLTQLFRRRRPAARPAFVRRLALEYLEDRNAPSALDPTSSLTPSDTLTLTDQSGTQSLTAPAPTDTSSSGSGTTSTAGSPSAPTTGTFLGALTATAVPTPTTGSGTTTTGGGTAAGPNGVTPPPASGLFIDSCAGTENPDLTVTVSGHVTFSNPAGLTVTFGGWVMDGMQAPVDAGGNFTITFNVPQCTSTTTAS